MPGKNKISVVLTRSREENYKAGSLLKKAGFRPIYTPLLEYSPADFDISLLGEYSDIVISSPRAARRIKGLLNDRPQNLWIVGESSINSLKGLKNKNIKTFLDFGALENFLKDREGEFLYLSSDFISKEPPKNFRRLIAYKTLYSSEISDRALAELSGGVDYICLYSANCAKVFINLLKKYDLLGKLENSYIIALSYRIAEIVEPYFGKIYYREDKRLSDIVGIINANPRII